MSSGSSHLRRGSTSSRGVPIPTAPPLPILTPRPLQRARDVASRFLGYGAAPSRPPSDHGDRDEERFARGSAQFRRQPSLGVSQDATASHRTGLEINTIAANEAGTHALIGGKGIFKTVKIEDGHCAEDLNLRTTILSTPRNASGAPRNIYQIDIADVAWANGDHGDYVAAATSSGKIILYNLAVAGLQGAQLHEHSRQVHKVTFNPHRGNLLLSGSQDGTVRLWDLRDVKHQASTLQSRRKYSGQADGVRDVKWSPTEGLDFAFGTDTGDVQRWDLRNLKQPKVKISAHLLASNAIDWHPDGKHLVSASSDKTIRVFDVSIARPKKPTWEIKTPYPVMNARWRPSFDSTFSSDNGAKLCIQILTSYDTDHPIMHLWDFRRPFLPFRELAPYNSAPTDLIWHSQDLLWTVGREGILMQTDLQHVPKAIEHRNLQSIAISPDHELVHATQARTIQKAPNPKRTIVKPKMGLSASPENTLLSRSWADDSIDQLFLGASPGHRLHARSESNNRLQQALSASASSTHERASVATLKLDDMLVNRKTYRPKQIAMYGAWPLRDVSHNIASSFMYDMMHLSWATSIEGCIEQVSDLVEGYMAAATSAGAYRLAQTWEIVRFCVENHLQERALRKRSLTLQKDQTERPKSPRRLSIARLAARFAAQYLRSPTHSPMSLRPVPTMIQHLGHPDSTSDVPTPLARATTTSRAPNVLALPDPSEDQLDLPPSLAHEQSLLTQHVQREKELAKSPEQRLTADNLIDFANQQRHTEPSDRNEMVRRWSVQPRVPLNFDHVEYNKKPQRPKLEKHDSDESFRFLEGSFESGETSFPDSLSSIQSPAQIVAERPTRRAGVEPTNGDEPANVPSSQPMPFDGSGTLANSTTLERSDTRTSIDSRMDTLQNWSPDGPRPQDLPVPALNVVTEVAETPEAIDNEESQRPRSPSAKSPGPGSTASDHEVESTTARNPTHAAASRPPDLSSVRSFGAPEMAAPARDVECIDLEEDKPWTLVDMLRQLLHFYTAEQPHPQALTMLILLVGRLLPLTHSLPDDETRRTVRILLEHSVDHLGLEQDDIHRWFTACDYEQQLQAGLQPLQLEHILSTHHEQLLARRAFVHAAELRKLAYPAFPAVYDDFLKDNRLHFQCGDCGRAIASGGIRTRCARCLPKHRSCQICWQPRSPWEPAAAASGAEINAAPQNASGQARLRSACMSCGHGGHAACYHFWFVTSAGVGCPTQGCVCPCVAVA